MSERKILIILISVFAIVAAAVLINASASAEDDGYYILCHPDSRVNVRSKPEMDAPVVGWVEYGRFVKTDGRTKGKFVHVTDLAAEVTDGWIYAGYLVYDPPRKEAYKAEVWGGSVIARSCIGGKRLRTLKEGAVVTVYARSNAWAVTSRGFVMCDWLREVD